MADLKITDLTELTTLATGDVFPVVDASAAETKKVAFSTIIAQGSNADGEYVRFADGTQVCWGEGSSTGVDHSTAFAGGYRSALTSADNRDFPAAFIATPKMVCQYRSGDTLPRASILDAAAYRHNYWRVTSATVDGSYDWVATGRWF